MRVISYGGGVQSTALVVLAGTEQLGDVDAALFCNVGDDSEHPDTLRYVRDIAEPWAAERGLPVLELHRTLRDGTPETLMYRLMRAENQSVPIPVRLPAGPPGSRSCTADFKIRVLSKWLKAQGVTADDPADVLIGISIDEIQRLNNRPRAAGEVAEYPLIDRRLSRQDCKNIIAEAGLPVPPKSACFFCPFHRLSVWAEQRRDEPDLFWKSVELERHINRRRDELGKGRVYLTDRGRPLDEAVGEAQQTLDVVDEHGETCDEGFCWT
jgi:hypothetical protein